MRTAFEDLSSFSGQTNKSSPGLFSGQTGVNTDEDVMELVPAIRPKKRPGHSKGVSVCLPRLRVKLRS